MLYSGMVARTHCEYEGKKKQTGKRYLQQKIFSSSFLRTDGSRFLERFAHLVEVNDCPQKSQNELDISIVNILRPDIHQSNMH